MQPLLARILQDHEQYFSYGHQTVGHLNQGLLPFPINQVLGVFDWSLLHSCSYMNFAHCTSPLILLGVHYRDEQQNVAVGEEVMHLHLGGENT